MSNYSKLTEIHKGITNGTWNVDTERQFKEEINSRLTAIEKRLSLINPNEELIKKYPALKEAYEHYKIIEALVNNGK